MKKVFNITGSCIPRLHYMVNLESRLQAIRKMVDAGQYITINRGRQYGKTTTLKALAGYLSNDYYVLNMDFQTAMSSAAFQTEEAFAKAFVKAFCFLFDLLDTTDELDNQLAAMQKAAAEPIELVELFRCLAKICKTAAKPIVLLIDEVDSASNNQVFLDFLAQLRGYYLNRDTVPAFHSVILAGVHDIRNLQLKIRSDAEHKHNSPWNIATALEINMSFSSDDIAGMLEEYEADHSTGMDIAAVSQIIYDYTSGYPVLVSMICKFMDENTALAASEVWTAQGVKQAVRQVLFVQAPLFESLINKLEQYPALKQQVCALLEKGSRIPYRPDDEATKQAIMFGFAKVQSGSLVIANRIFETRFYDMLLTDPGVTDTQIYRAAEAEKPQFTQNGQLNMELILEKFVQYFHDIYGEQTERFIEDDGRKLFLIYLRPIINGTGNYYIEAQTRDLTRTDVIVDYLGHQYVIEMKIWRGKEYNERGEQQLAEYLDYFHIKKGYMLSFNFNKNKQVGTKTIQIGDKTLFEAVV